MQETFSRYIFNPHLAGTTDSPCVVYSGPVQEIEYQKEKRKEDQEGEVRHGVRVLLPPEAVELPELHLEEDAGVLHEGGEHEHDAADHPGLHRGQSLGLAGALYLLMT